MGTVRSTGSVVLSIGSKGAILLHSSQGSTKGAWALPADPDQALEEAIRLVGMAALRRPLVLWADDTLFLRRDRLPPVPVLDRQALLDRHIHYVLTSQTGSSAVIGGGCWDQDGTVEPDPGEDSLTASSFFNGSSGPVLRASDGGSTMAAIGMSGAHLQRWLTAFDQRGLSPRTHLAMPWLIHVMGCLAARAEDRRGRDREEPGVSSSPNRPAWTVVIAQLAVDGWYSTAGNGGSPCLLRTMPMEGTTGSPTIDVAGLTEDGVQTYRHLRRYGLGVQDPLRIVILVGGDIGKPLADGLRRTLPHHDPDLVISVMSPPQVARLLALPVSLSLQTGSADLLCAGYAHRITRPWMRVCAGLRHGLARLWAGTGSSTIHAASIPRMRQLGTEVGWSRQHSITARLRRWTAEHPGRAALMVVLVLGSLVAGPLLLALQEVRAEHRRSTVLLAQFESQLAQAKDRIASVSHSPEDLRFAPMLAVWRDQDHQTPSLLAARIAAALPQAERLDLIRIGPKVRMDGHDRTRWQDPQTLRIRVRVVFPLARFDDLSSDEVSGPARSHFKDQGRHALQSAFPDYVVTLDAGSGKDQALQGSSASTRGVGSRDPQLGWIEYRLEPRL